MGETGCWMKDTTYRQRPSQRCLPDDEQSNLCGSDTREQYEACHGVSDDGVLTFNNELRLTQVMMCKSICAKEPDCAGFEEYLGTDGRWYYKLKAHIAIINPHSHRHNCHIKEKYFQLGLRTLVTHDLAVGFPNYRSKRVMRHARQSNVILMNSVWDSLFKKSLEK